MRSNGIPMLVALLCAVGCHSEPSTSPTPWTSDPRWLVLRVDAVNVAPYHAGTTNPWDGQLPQPTDGAECGLLGLAVTFINPIVGMGTEYLCQIGTRPRQQEQDPTAPDLLVTLGVGASVQYQTYTARDTFYHLFQTEFLVPTDAIPLDGLMLTVLDRDGSQSEVIGTQRLDRAQLVGAAQSGRVLSLRDPRGGLQGLDLVVSRYAVPAQSTLILMNARDGMSKELRQVRAGEAIEVSASGQYRVGSYYDRWLDPKGYHDGGPRSYNFANEPFRSAPHGSGIAMVGKGDAMMGLIVAPCARFVTRVAGPLVVGINDREPKNNEGSVQFIVHAWAPDPAEWLSGQTEPCSTR